eukprot:CAMPEP_0196592822 /NCGR_PEP_ID=MMETSP1081-20130531/73901_1 /TAXON_ID=36882 /ORGANISM="Pyramimonas amylifera, Strain CCMP720" /LENGTH=160 /DNA_ID=CAMNT_0041916627 /DNA_START=557 /DNA_END=1039 /DNA_ORIENTATION=+
MTSPESLSPASRFIEDSMRSPKMEAVKVTAPSSTAANWLPGQPVQAFQKRATKMEPRSPHIAPSTVFFGEIRIRGVLPNLRPPRYAKVSAATMQRTGRNVQSMPASTVTWVKAEEMPSVAAEAAAVEVAVNMLKNAGRKDGSVMVAGMPSARTRTQKDGR